MDLVLRDVTRVSLLVRKGYTDQVSIVLKDTTAYPMMKYSTVVSLSLQKGEGENWCRNYLGVEPEIINVD